MNPSPLSAITDKERQLEQEMGLTRGRSPVTFPDEPINLDEVAQNLPPSGPVVRSLSKSCLRDPSQRYPPPARAQVIDRAEDDISVQSTAQSLDNGVEMVEEFSLLPHQTTLKKQSSTVEKLPTEIMESIISHLGGQLGLAGSRGSHGRDWGHILRHPRRKDITDLAFVSPTFRRLVQERIFRHRRSQSGYEIPILTFTVKVQGTRASLSNLWDFFRSHPHLQEYVRHVQVIVPLWETLRGPESINTEQEPGNLDREGSIWRALYQSQAYGLVGLVLDHHAEHPHMFRPSTQRATLAEIFSCCQVLLPGIHALTIESAHCKHPPQIPFFNPSVRIPTSTRMDLPTLPGLEALILRGAWNTIRSSSDLALLTKSIPSLKDLTLIYHSPKTAPYKTMCAVLHPRNLPPQIRHINLCMEGPFHKPKDTLAKWKKVYPAHHLCRTLGATLPHLETLTYTGRLCGTLFSEATKTTQALHPEQRRTRRVDIIVKNVCRDTKAIHDNTGIQSLGFMQAFETLVVQALKLLRLCPKIKYLRLRFIDLDSATHALAPAFHFEGVGDRGEGEAWGLWSKQIRDLFYEARPAAKLIDPFCGDESLVRECRPGRKQSIPAARYYQLTTWV